MRIIIDLVTSKLYFKYSSFDDYSIYEKNLHHKYSKLPDIKIRYKQNYTSLF